MNYAATTKGLIVPEYTIRKKRGPLCMDFFAGCGRMIVELQPKMFVMEEVPAIVNFFDPDGVPVLDKFCMMLQEGGYGKWDMLKKGLLMQTGCGAGIKSVRGNEKIKRTQRKVKPKPHKQFEQVSLF